MAALLGAIAEIERAAIRERVRQGIASARLRRSRSSRTAAASGSFGVGTERVIRVSAEGQIELLAPDPQSMETPQGQMQIQMLQQEAASMDKEDKVKQLTPLIREHITNTDH